MKKLLNNTFNNPRIFTLIIPHEPIPWIFHKPVTPKPAYNAQLTYVQIAKSHLQEQLKKPLTCQLILSLTFHLPFPPYISAYHQNELINQPHITLPPLTPLIKMYMTICEHTLFNDERHISALTARKIYSPAPHTEVLVTCL
jgi:hypothetical protein